MNENFPLILRLISHLPVINLYPSKHKKGEKKDNKYIHLSVHWINGKRIPVTFKREEPKAPSKRDIHRNK